ncbi:hypothetical protein [Streptomyces sp. NBC_00467]|uniref:hypothetical protein n=1 Tax=Streptomyces sp. NBC_00467 TaxID=2975752 RepID=UPI002E174DAF
MHFTSERRLDDGVLEREFTLGEIPGTLWTPESSAPAPLILMAHNNGLPKGEPRLVARARHSATCGYAVATIDASGCGDRPRSADEEQARAGGYVPRAQREEARQVTIPLLFLLQWDDEGNPRQRALELFDAFGTKEKTLHANLGGHTGTPWFEVEDGNRFFGRHLK